MTNYHKKVLSAYDGTTGASNGNLADDGTLELSYDALNRLIEVKRKSDGATIGEYTYDALNRRVSKTISNGGVTNDVPNGTTNYYYRNWQVIEERDGSDNAVKQYVWGQYIDECIQLKTLTTTGPQSLAAGDYYPLQDLLYQTTALTDASGDIVEAYDYDAYGNTLIFSAAGTGSNWWTDDAVQANYSACEVLYCGYRYDPEAKEYQVRNREYNPTLGRWLQRDTIGFDGGDWNLYGYVGERSVILIDPFGYQAKPGDVEYDPYYDPYRGGPPPTRTWPDVPPRKTPPPPVSWTGQFYGHYCGAQTSNPINYLTGKRPSPIDAVDSCCQQHDDCFARHSCNAISQFTSVRCRACNSKLSRCVQEAVCISICCQLVKFLIIMYGNGIPSVGDPNVWDKPY